MTYWLMLNWLELIGIGWKWGEFPNKKSQFRLFTIFKSMYFENWMFNIVNDVLADVELVGTDRNWMKMSWISK